MTRLAIEKTKTDWDAFIAKAGPLIAEQFEAYGRAAVQPGLSTSPSFSLQPMGRCGGSRWRTTPRRLSTR